jgi:hypothetical protein
MLACPQTPAADRDSPPLGLDGSPTAKRPRLEVVWGPTRTLRPTWRPPRGCRRARARTSRPDLVWRGRRTEFSPPRRLGLRGRCCQRASRLVVHLIIARRGRRGRPAVGVRPHAGRTPGPRPVVARRTPVRHARNDAVALLFDEAVEDQAAAPCAFVRTTGWRPGGACFRARPLGAQRRGLDVDPSVPRRVVAVATNCRPHEQEERGRN